MPERDRQRLRDLARIEESEAWKALRPIIVESLEENAAKMALAVEPAIIHRLQGAWATFRAILDKVDGAGERLRKLETKQNVGGR